MNETKMAVAEKNRQKEKEFQRTRPSTQQGSKRPIIPPRHETIEA
jgi:hypothetical protein